MKHNLLLILFYSTIYFIEINGQFSISESINAFSINLLSTITNNKAADSVNLALSPYTVWTLLTVLSEGAQGNTEKELENVLYLTNDKKPVREGYMNLTNGLTNKREGVDVDYLNTIFMHQNFPVKKDYEAVINKFYNVNIRPIDFGNTDQACKIINDYVAKATKNRIQKIVKNSDLYTSHLFLTTTLYFKGIWKNPFNTSFTKVEPFFNEKGNLIGNVQMMYRNGVYPYAKIKDISAYAVELPYNGDISMIVILPYQGKPLSSVLNALSKQSFTNILKILNDSEMMFVDEEVEVYLPRFSVVSDLNLIMALNDMGLKEVFDSQKSDLLGMAPHYLYVSSLLQRAEIDVNEEGTVASAVSGASVTNKSPSPVFHANNPFLYFIVDKRTNTIIFSGKISNPKDSK